MARYQELVDAMRNAARTGRTDVAQRIATMIQNKQYDEESSGVASALQGVGQGATFGFADELGAGVRAGIFDPLVSTVFGGDVGGVGGEDMTIRESIGDYFANMGERYNMALGSQRDALETARREDPWTTGIAEVVGGLGTGGIGLGKAAAGQTLRQGIKRGAGAGLGMGALAGYGYGGGDPIAAALQEVVPGGAGTGDYTRALSELKEAGVSAGIGAAFGTVIGGGLPVVGSMIRGTARFLASPFTKQARLNEAGRRQIVDQLERDIVEGNITMEQARRELAQHPGMSIADLTPGLRGMAEDIAQTGTAAGRRIAETLETRAEGQYGRIMPGLSRALGLGGEPSMFHHHLQAMGNSARRAADRMFKNAYRTPINMTRSMYNTLTKTKTGEAGLRLARELAREQQKKLPGIGKTGTMNKAETMHLILQGMDDHVDDMFRNSTPKLARAARDVRDAFRREVLDQNKGLRDARSLWRGHRENEEAALAGRRIFTDDFDLTAINLERMSESGRLHFRMGVLKEIEKRMARKIDTADMTRDLLRKRESRNALRIAFGDEDNFRRFMETLELERKMQKTFEAAVGNSATARRLAQAGTDFGEKLSALAGYGISLSSGIGLPPSIGGYLARRGYQATGAPARAQRAYEGLASNQADILMGGDLAGLMRPKTLGGLLDTGIPMTTAAGAGALIGGGAAPQGLLEQVDY